MAVWPLAHTVTPNYTYQKSEIAHWGKWLKWNLWDGCMALAHTVTQSQDTKGAVMTETD